MREESMLRNVSLLVLMTHQAFFSPAWAAQTGNGKTQRAFETSTPAEVNRRSAESPFKCPRSFVYQGKHISCDSNVRKDAEGLRPILNSVPDAVSELNIYQKNRRDVQTAAYVGSLGLIIVLAGLILSSTFDPQDPQRITVRNYAGFGGLGLTIGSAIYGFSVINANEAHLDKAVQNFNQARPHSPIELEFTTGINF